MEISNFPTWRSAILNSDLSPTTRLILLVISLHTNEVGSGAFPTTRELAEQTGLTTGVVRRNIRIAKQKEWLGEDSESYHLRVPEDGVLPATSGRDILVVKEKVKEKEKKKIYKRKKAKEKRKEKNTKFLPISKLLSGLISEHKNITHSDSNLEKWSNEFRLLSDQNDISISRMKKALRGYRKIYGLDFVPVIDSGRAFRNKFLNLESAIERESKPKPNKSGRIGAARTGATHKPDLVIED